MGLLIQDKLLRRGIYRIVFNDFSPRCHQNVFMNTFSCEVASEIRLEKFSGKASESCPVFGKKYFFMGKYSWNLPGKIFRKIPWVMPQNCKIWKKSGKFFRDIPWVMPRFLEKFSGICLYGLTRFQKRYRSQAKKFWLLMIWCRLFWVVKPHISLHMLIKQKNM